MITTNRLLLPAALAAVLAAGCANNDNGRNDDEYERNPPPATGAEDRGLEGWQPTEAELDLMSEEEYEQRYSEQIDASNVDEEFEKLQKELGGG